VSPDIAGIPVVARVIAKHAGRPGFLMDLADRLAYAEPRDASLEAAAAAGRTRGVQFIINASGEEA
jgi:hypothetical protein